MKDGAKGLLAILGAVAILLAAAGAYYFTIGGGKGKAAPKVTQPTAAVAGQAFAVTFNRTPPPAGQAQLKIKTATGCAQDPKDDKQYACYFGVVRPGTAQSQCVGVLFTLDATTKKVAVVKTQAVPTTNCPGL